MRVWLISVNLNAARHFVAALPSLCKMSLIKELKELQDKSGELIIM